MGSFDRLNSAIDKAINAAAVLAAAFIVFILLTTNFEVIGRKLFNFSLIWSMPYSEFSIAYIVFFGTAWLLKREGHVRIDIVLNWLSRRKVALITAITSIIAAILCIVLAYVSASVTWDHFLRGIAVQQTIETPKAPLLAVIPVGFALLFIQFVRRTFRNIQVWKHPVEEETGNLKR